MRAFVFKQSAISSQSLPMMSPVQTNVCGGQDSSPARHTGKQLSLQPRQRLVSQRWPWWTLRATTKPSDGLDDDLLSATLEVSQTQLLAQIADETSLDSRTMGILAFNGALLAAAVAARNLLGTWWWTPLLALSLPTLMCLRSALAKETDLGPLAITFYANYGGQ